MEESPKPLLIEKKQFKSQTIYFRAEKVNGPVKVRAKQTPKKKQKSKKNPGKIQERRGEEVGMAIVNCTCRTSSQNGSGAIAE